MILLRARYKCNHNVNSVTVPEAVFNVYSSYLVITTVECLLAKRVPPMYIRTYTPDQMKYVFA